MKKVFGMFVMVVVMAIGLLSYAGRLEDAIKDWHSGISKKQKPAMEIIKSLAKQGNAKAQYVLSKAYSSQQIPPSSNNNDGMIWLAKAAKGGCVDAQYDYAKECFNGWGTAKGPVKPNREEGIIWLKKAINGGNEDAQELLSKVEEGMEDALVVNAGERIKFGKPKTNSADLPRKASSATKDSKEIWDLGSTGSMTEDQRRQCAIDNRVYITATDLFYRVFDKDMESDTVAKYKEDTITEYPNQMGPDGTQGWTIFKVEVKYITQGGYEKWDVWQYAFKSRGKNWRVKIGSEVYETYTFYPAPRSGDSGYLPEVDWSKANVNGKTIDLR